MSLGRDTGQVRQHNRAIVLDLLRTRGPLSRPALARRGGVSRPTVIEITNDLIREGLIREVGYGPSTGGRRPVLVELVPESQWSIGVRIGLRSVTAVLTDLRATVHRRAEVPFQVGEGPVAFLALLQGVFADLVEPIPGGWRSVRGIGVAMPGLVLRTDPATIVSWRYPEWQHYGIEEQLTATYDVPAVLDNNANTAALGEHFFGAGRGTKHMLYVLISQGIGGGVIVNGEIYRGAAGGAGEIGHLTIDFDGPRCDCGKHGCLQVFVSADAIARLAKQDLILTGRDRLAGRKLDGLTADDVIDAARDGDEAAARIVAETGRYLGVGLANAAQILSPSLIVLGGPVARAGRLILEPAIQVARRHSTPGLADQTRIVLGQLGEDAEAIGAAVLPLRDLFNVAIPEDGSVPAHENGRAGQPAEPAQR
jgi:glucokinase-like ROK family protein